MPQMVTHKVEMEIEYSEKDQNEEIVGRMLKDRLELGPLFDVEEIDVEEIEEKTDNGESWDIV